MVLALGLVGAKIVRGASTTPPQQLSHQIRTKRQPVVESEENGPEIRLAILGGAGFAPPPRQEAGHQAMVFGAEGEVSYGMVGVEADATYGFGLGVKETDSGDGFSGNPDDHSFFGNAKFQIPFETGQTKWTPKVGVGYAFMSADGGDQSAIDSLNGVFLVTGLEIEREKRFIIDFDYAFSLSAQTNDEFADAEESPSFYRVRAGVFLRTGEHVYVGTRFVEHGISLPQIKAPGFTDSDRQMECLGVVLFQL